MRAPSSDPTARAPNGVHAPGRDLSAVNGALQEQLDAAMHRLADLRERRHRLERELDAAVAAEVEARGRLAALRSVAESVSGAVLLLEPDTPPSPTTRTLAGGDLRDAIARVTLRRNAHGQAVHWRTWYDWLLEAGFTAAGKRGEATFQTQLVRSPLVRRADREGVYVLDVDLLQQLRGELLELHDQLAQLPPADQLALMGDVRTERRALQQRIGRTERTLEEAWRVLTEELGSDWTGGVHDAEQLVERWRRRIRSD